MLIDSPDITGSLLVDGEFNLPTGPTNKRPTEPFTGSLRFNTDSGSLELYDGVGWSGVEGGGGGTGAGFPYSGSAVITGSLYVSGGNISGSFVGDGAGLTGVTINQFATVEDTFTNATSHSVVHNFGTKNVFVQVFESDDTLLIPYSVTTTTANQVDIVLGDTLSGRVVIGKAGHLLQDTGNFVSSSTAVQTFTNATTASINHYLDSLNVITQVFDSNNNVIVPSNIKVATKDRVDLTFASSRSGKVVIAKAGHIVSGTAAVSASYATTATSASLSSVSERVRAGSSGSRPTTAESGSLWYNTNTSNLEIYNGASGSGWSSVGSTTPTTPYEVDFLAVAGGGGGNIYNGGGGGAGGLRTSYGSTSGGGTSAETNLTFIPNTTYTITVGAGGAGSNTMTVYNGDTSTILGTGITTVTSAGGGAGGARNTSPTGQDGGSGGGGGSTASGGQVAGSGTAGQGYNGGAGADLGGYQGGGGGGAAAAGSRPGGGAGLAVNILNSTDATTYTVGEVSAGNVYYAGGGGGGANSGPGTGGIGGGANGTSNYSMNNGDPNSGGGGGSGAMSGTFSGGNGGSGVVILRMATSDYTGTTSGNPTVTTDGLDTVITFKTSGTYTA